MLRKFDDKGIEIRPFDFADSFLAHMPTNIREAISHFKEGKIPCGREHRTYFFDKPNFHWGPSEVEFLDSQKVNGTWKRVRVKHDPRGKKKTLEIHAILKAAKDSPCRTTEVKLEIVIKFENDKEGNPVNYGIQGTGYSVSPLASKVNKRDFPCEIPEYR